MRLNRKRMTSVAILPSFIFIESSCVFPIYCDKFYLTLKPLQFRTSPLISSVLQKKYEAELGWYGLMSPSGKVITPPRYCDITAIGYDLYLCKTDDIRGEVLLLPFHLLNYPHHHSSLP